MNEARNYAKIVKWSEEDGKFVGMAPGLFHGGCHGDDERKVYAELCDLVEFVLESHEADGDPLPEGDPPNISDLADWFRERKRIDAPLQEAAE